MKLRKGLSVVIGRRTYSDEIPDERFALITRDWSQSKVDDFIRMFGAEKKKAKKKD